MDCWREQHAEATTNILDNTRHHIIGVYDGSNVIIYVDGIEEDIVAQTGTIGTDARNLVISADGNEVTQSNIDGTIQYIYIYNRALSPYEVAWLNREPYAMFQQPINPAMLYYETPSGISIPVLMQQMNQFNGGLIA